jgi:hypothetical protein
LDPIRELSLGPSHPAPDERLSSPLETHETRIEWDFPFIFNLTFGSPSLIIQISTSFFHVNGKEWLFPNRITQIVSQIGLSQNAMSLEARLATRQPTLHFVLLLLVLIAHPSPIVIPASGEW